MKGYIFIIAIIAVCSFSNASSNVRYVNPMLGTDTNGHTDGGYGGMIPSVSTPFGMTRFTPQSRENVVGNCPYEYNTATKFYGFQATHQVSML